MTDALGIALATTQYSTNLELLLQQMNSKLRGRVREGSHVGKMASPINQIGAIQMKAPAGRFAPKNTVQATLQRRWVFPQDAEADQLVDSFDQLKTLIDVKSEYMTDVAAAVGRSFDDALIAAAYGTAQLGVDAGGLTPETFDTTKFTIAHDFGASATTGLTVAKLIEAKRIFRHYHNDLEADPITVVIGSQQESDLLNQVQVVSTDFNDKPVLVDGKVTRFLGMDIVVIERIPVVSNDRQVLAFVKSGLYLGLWQEMLNRISIRNDLSSEPWDLHTQVSFGATRTQPGKVLQILCNDTTGADITP